MATYSTNEAAERSGISKNTLLRWIAEGRVPDARRDWRGWRVWSEEDILRLKEFQERTFVPSVRKAASSPVVKAEVAVFAAKSMARYGRAMAASGKGQT